MGQKITIIGAGIIGASIAASLAKKGSKITLISSEPIGAPTSRASFAWFNAIQKFPKPYYLMNMNGMQAHKKFAASYNSSPWYHPRGNVEWTNTFETNALLNKVFEKMLSLGYQGQRLTNAELLKAVPAIKMTAIKGAEIVKYPDEGWIDLQLLLARHLADLRSLSADIIIGNKVIGFDTKNGRIHRVILDNNTKIETDLVINAAGIGASSIASLVGQNLPLKNSPGVQVFTTPVPSSINTVMHGPGLSVRPDGGGRLCLHDHGIDRELITRPGIDDNISENANGELSFKREDALALVDTLKATFHDMEGASIENARLAFRPIPQDGYPVIGFSTKCENFYSAVMHSGVTQCIWVGDLVAREVLDDENIDELSTFRPDRFET